MPDDEQTLFSVEPPRPQPAAVDRTDGSEPRLYYQGSHITIWHGDALDVLPTLDQVDLIATDPPVRGPLAKFPPNDEVQADPRR